MREPWFDAPTPWGESLGALVDAVLADKSAPPVLLLAAYKARHLDAPAGLRSLIADAVALNEAEAANSQSRPGQ